jgi:hypothetical protein
MASDDLTLPLTNDDLIYEREPLYKWCCIYTGMGIVVFGGIITLVYFFWN